MSNSKHSLCPIKTTPKETNKILSKMKLPSIPNIAINALNIINNLHIQNVK